MYHRKCSGAVGPFAPPARPARKVIQTMKHARTIPARFALAAFLLAATAAPARAADAYIESDGTQAINTGYYINAKTKLEIDFEVTEVVSQARLFGQTGTGCGNCAVVYFGDAANNFKFGYGNSFNGVFLAANNTRRNTIIYDGPNDKGYLLQDGAQVAEADLTAAHDATANFPMALFAECQNAAGRQFQNFAKMRLYGVKIHEDGALVHDYVPTIKGGVAGLLDSVTGTFLYDTRTSGAAAFAYGGDIEVLDDDPYIQSAGTDAINLGLGASPKLKIEVDYALTDTTKTQQRIVGQDTSPSTPRISIYQNGNGPITLAAVISTSDWNQSVGAVNTGAGNDTDRHTAIVDCGERTLSFMTGVTTNWTYSATVPEVVTCATRPLGLFGNPNNDAGTSFQSDKFSTAKIYGLKIWAGGTLVRDLAPRNIDGTAGFEDRVTGKFYTCGGLTASANAPTTLSGPSKEGDAFIESDGSYYSTVDARYFVKPTTKIEIDYQLASFVNGGIVMGGYGSAAGVSTILWCRNNSTLVMEMQDGNHNDNANNLLSPQTPPDLARHTAVFDGPNRHLTLKGADGTVEAEADFNSAWTLSATAKWPVLLFASANNAYGKSKQVAKARIYGVRFYEGGNLVLELTPAVKGGVAGFADGDGNFYSGDGLTAGGNVMEIDDDPYVASPDGGCFFDTGYYVTSNTCIKIDYMPLEQHANQQFPFEAGARDGTRMFMRTYANGGAGTGDIAYFCGNTDNISLEVPFAPNVRRILTLDAYNLKAKVETSGKTVRDAPIGAAGKVPEKSSSTLKIFSNAAANDHYLYGRLYGFKIYEEGNLVHDYAPICQNGSYALVDKVEGKVLAKAANSAAFTGFTANSALNDDFFNAPMRAEDAYIESDGTQGINLGYLTTPNTRYEIDYQLTATTKQYRPFGQADTSVQNLNAELYVQDTLNVAFGVGDTWKGHPTGVASDTDRHVAFIDFANRECGYSGYKIFAFDSAVVCKNTAVVPMWLFAKGAKADGSFVNRAKMKLYAFRIYESGVLVHEYLPYKVGNVVGLYDTMTGGAPIASSVSGSNAFTYGGGLGYGKFAGDLTDLVVEPADTQVGVNATKTLSAYAPGATSYVWTRNGETLAGTTGTECIVAWEKPSSVGTLVYAVTPVFTKGGETVYGASAEAEVTMAPASFLMVVR